MGSESAASSTPGAHTGRWLVRGLGMSQGSTEGAGLRAGPSGYPAEGTPGGQPAVGSTGKERTIHRAPGPGRPAVRGPHTRRPRAQGPPAGPASVQLRVCREGLAWSPAKLVLWPHCSGGRPATQARGREARPEPVPGTHRLGAPLPASLHPPPQLLRKATGRPLP